MLFNSWEYVGKYKKDDNPNKFYYLNYIPKNLFSKLTYRDWHLMLDLEDIYWINF